MDRTWMPTVAGILNIIAGALSAIAWLLLIVGFSLFAVSSSTSSLEVPREVPFNFGMLTIIFLSIPILVMLILTIVGGIYALKRKIWGLALAGSIAAIIISSPLGIAATVFTALSKNEFE
jgi:hypothetical protein